MLTCIYRPILRTIILTVSYRIEHELQMNFVHQMSKVYLVFITDTIYYIYEHINVVYIIVRHPLKLPVAI